MIGIWDETCVLKIKCLFINFPSSRTVMWATLAVEVALISGRVSPVSVTATQGSVTQIPDAVG